MKSLLRHLKHDLPLILGALLIIVILFLIGFDRLITLFLEPNFFVDQVLNKAGALP